MINTRAASATLLMPLRLWNVLSAAMMDGAKPTDTNWRRSSSGIGFLPTEPMCSKNS
jgi:hypothetical protein